MATAQVVCFCFCDVTMAKPIRINKLPSSPPPPLPLCIRRQLSVFQLVYRYHYSKLTHTVLLLFCQHLLANRNFILHKIIKLTFPWHHNINQCLTCCTSALLKGAFSPAKFCQIVHIDLCVIFYFLFFLFCFVFFFFGLFVFYFQTSTYAIADNSSYGFVASSKNLVAVKVSQKQTILKSS